MVDRAARIWCGWVGPSCPGEPEALAPWLDASETGRAEGFGSAARRREFLLGRALARAILHERFGLEPRGLVLGSDERGRLRIASPPGSGLSVSVSHSRGVVAAAATAAGALGLDIERLREVPRAEAIAARWFTEAERLQLAERKGPAQARHFLALWTLKEAQLKATGEGLAGALGAFGFEIAADGLALPVARIREGSPPWSFRSFALGPECVAAAALQAGGPGLEVSARELRLGEAPGAPRRPPEAPPGD